MKGIYIVDTKQYGLSEYGASYILKGEKTAIIEAGTSFSVEEIMRELEPEAVAYIMVTHIHLDHAGGAGVLAERCPNSKVVVHERGADHLIDPSYLLKSVSQATGKMFKHYGTAFPIPEERIIRVSGGERFDFGGFAVEVIDAPGHAPHHMCFFEHATKSLFVGDAAGIYLDRLLPTTPPPSFNLERSLLTLRKLKDLKPRRLFYTHYGLGDPKLLDEYARLLERWVEEIRELRGKMGDEAVISFLVDKYRSFLYEPVAEHEISMYIRGVFLYLDNR